MTTHERGTPHNEAIANTLRSSIKCARANGLHLHDINGWVPEWCNHLRNEHGERPSTDDFFAEWNRQLTEASREPAPPVDDE
jgi:hypothetical protein